ncbi:MAG: NAD(P)H-dependent oxidoreductase [Oscillospiraceae bacterium]|nr:NAD(P)H-dependent oxidoreductase [Oscillospiraceae bacterium]
MKIVMIHGQNHSGTTWHMGRILADKLAGEEDIIEFFLPRDLNHFCLGCYACIEDETKCPYWGEKKKLLDAMEQADLFIFTTPNYCLAPSGAMKSLIDLFFDLWMVHRPKAWMFSQRAVVLSASAGASCKKAVGPVKDSLFYWGVPYIKTYGLAVQAANWDMVKPEKKEKIERHLTKLASKIHADEGPRVGFKTKFIFNMMKMTHVKGWDSSPVEKQYWEERGWLGKTRPWKK